MNHLNSKQLDNIATLCQNKLFQIVNQQISKTAAIYQTFSPNQHLKSRTKTQIEYYNFLFHQILNLKECNAVSRTRLHRVGKTLTINIVHLNRKLRTTMPNQKHITIGNWNTETFILNHQPCPTFFVKSGRHLPFPA